MAEPTIEDIPLPKKSHIIAIGVIFAVLLLFGTFVRLLGDLLWFNSVELPRVFWTALLAKLSLGAAAFAVMWAVIYGNMRLARRRAGRSKFLLHIEADSPVASFRELAPVMETAMGIGAVVIAYLVGTWAAVRWETVLRFMNLVPFGVNDPILGQDISVNVFEVPFYRLILGFLFTCVVFSAIGAFLSYLFRGCFMVTDAGVWMAKEARSHLIFLLGCLLLLLGFHFHLGLYDLLIKQRVVAPGAGYADVHGYLIFLKVLRYVAILAGGLVWYGAVTGRAETTLAATGTGVVVAGMILGAGYRSALQQFKVGPSELALERPYIEMAIDYTRRAYKLDGVRQETFAAEENLSLTSIRKNSATIQNIRLWDHVPLLTTYGQLQEIRTYYQFLDVDNDRYVIDGDYRQVMLSPRELLADNLPSRNWINEHLTYTHGYGLCLGPVNRISDEGLPEFFIKDIPPQAVTGVEVSRPEIYYGESNSGYAMVRTRSKEFDYPAGDENVYTRYDGEGGVALGGLLRRLLFAAYFREPKILLTGEITPDSRILYYRTIGERLAKAAPFLFFDPDPYLVVSRDGRLFWFVDAYTYTDRYPYSAAAGKGKRANYLRNSVKTVVDAYNGMMSFYIADTDDPMIKTYARIFPGMFKELKDMPEDLRSHIRYPHWYFSVQAAVYATFHMTDPQVFYNREDLWAISRRSQGGRVAAMEPYYTIMKLASEKGASEEFILMVPFTPAKKKNMIAWLAARCDQPHYGELLVYNFPKQKLVYGPEQIDNRIDQDAEIAEQITLWDQTGSRVIRGSLLVIPVEEALLYIQPLYLEAQGGGLPELRRVIVAHGNAIAMEPNLELSLARIFGGAAGRYAGVRPRSGEAAPRERTLKQLGHSANEAYQASKKALEKADWEAYGRALAELERLLRQMSASQQ